MLDGPANLQESIEVLLRELNNDDVHDCGFLQSHVARFAYLVRQLSEILPASRSAERPRIIELGSYHLHLSILLRRCGYDVRGVDLPIFAQRPIVRARAAQSLIENRPWVCDSLGKPTVIPYEDDSADVVICTEMLEHLTFNPVRLWSEAYRVVRSGGLVVITTPNSLSLFNVLATFKNLLTFRGVGISVAAILGGITTGHHWKEYSAKEIEAYLRSISPDFHLAHLSYYSYRDTRNGPALYRAIRFLEQRVLPPRFRPELFMVFRTSKDKGIVIDDPDAAILQCDETRRMDEAPVC
jgi:SAM-dependent methyltransferase